MNDSLSLKSSANCRAELTEHIAKIDDEDVQTLFMVLGSDDSFLDSLNANDPDFSNKLDEIVQGMFEATVDEREILKEVGPDLQASDVKK